MLSLLDFEYLKQVSVDADSISGAYEKIPDFFKILFCLSNDVALFFARVYKKIFLKWRRFSETIYDPMSRVPFNWSTGNDLVCGTVEKSGAFDSAKIHMRQRRRRQSVTAKREKSQTPKFV